MTNIPRGGVSADTSLTPTDVLTRQRQQHLRGDTPFADTLQHKERLLTPHPETEKS
jgi:hypothetical protein